MIKLAKFILLLLLLILLAGCPYDRLIDRVKGVEIG